MEKKIIKYLEGKSSHEEQQEILSWLREANNLTRFNSIKDEWWNENRGDKSKSTIDFNMHRLSDRLNEKKQLESSLKLSRFYKYAAVILLLVSISTSLLFTKYVNEKPSLQLTEVKTDFGQISSILLPDSTKVWINSGSTLTYNNYYGISNRDIAVNGEAFFEVHKNKKIPFIVDMKDLTIEVTGTEFGVSNYGDDENMNVILEEGSVNIHSARNNKLLMKLEPNEMAHFNKEAHTIEKRKVQPEHYTSWRNGIIHIFELPLSQLVHKLEKRYNQKFIVNDKRIAHLPITLSIENESLPDILKLIEKIAPVKAVQHGEFINLKYQP